MIRHLALVATVVFGGTLLAPQASQAQQTIDSLGLAVTTTPAVVSDYSFRGFSQTRRRPAAQLTVDAEHTSGLYVGAFVSNVAFPATNTRQEIDYNAGYRFAVGDLKLDIGATYYTYPGYTAPTGGFELNFWELALRSSYEIAPVKFVGLAAWSPNYTGESGSAVYLEGGFDMALDFGITFSFRGGYQMVERNILPAAGSTSGYFGTEDYGTLTFGVSREVFAGFIGSFTAVYNTLGSQADCFGGQKVCDTRVILGLSRPF